MRDPFQTDKKKRRRFRFLDFDAWIDSSIYSAAESTLAVFDRFSNFMKRFRVTGFRRFLCEAGSEGFTYLTIGAVLAVALAKPAFEEIHEGWNPQEDISVTFLDRFGNEIGKRGILQNDSVPLEALPLHLIQATLSTEDRRFYTHFGIDILGTLRALVENLRAGGVVQGGSSITQQLAKNLFLTNERKLERKINEAFLAMWLEVNFTKNEILKLYFDRAYMGGGAFGVAAASEFYFGKPVQQLTLAESAMFGGLFKAPTNYAPHINLPNARARANEVLTNMVQAGFLTEAQVLGARKNPATPVVAASGYAPDYFLDHAFLEVKELLGDSEQVVTVRTTIDIRIQNGAESAVESHLRQFGESFEVQEAATVVLEPNGAIVAMVGGRDYGQSQFNRATLALRQPGSSFKPFVYTTAMMNGFTPSDVVPDVPLRIGNWSPRNYGRNYRGRVTLKTALTKSINTVPVRLSQKLGRKKIAETARLMGVETPISLDVTMALGTGVITVIDMANAYAKFSNGGKATRTYTVSQVVNSAGKVVYDRGKLKQLTKQVIPEYAIASMNDILVNVVTSGTGRRALLPGIPVGGKTGTTQSYRDAWFVGFTGNYIAAVWFGNDNYAPTKRVTGGNLPARTWKAIMTRAHEGANIVPIPFVEMKTAIRIRKKKTPSTGRATGDLRLQANSAKSMKALAAIGHALARKSKRLRRSGRISTFISNQPVSFSTITADGSETGVIDTSNRINQPRAILPLSR